MPAKVLRAHRLPHLQFYRPPHCQLRSLYPDAHMLLRVSALQELSLLLKSDTFTICDSDIKVRQIGATRRPFAWRRGSEPTTNGHLGRSAVLCKAAIFPRWKRYQTTWNHGRCTVNVFVQSHCDHSHCTRHSLVSSSGSRCPSSSSSPTSTFSTTLTRSDVHHDLNPDLTISTATRVFCTAK